MVVLGSALGHGPSGRQPRASVLDLIDVSERTLTRWRRWWRAAVAGSRFWQALTGRVATPVDPARVPASLLERFGGDTQAQLLATWRVLLPITGGEGLAVQAR